MTSPANNVRVQNYPTLEEGNTAFPAAEYSIQHSQSAKQTGMILEHHLTGAQLILDMLKSGKAQYACAISSPKVGYRELLRSPDRKQELQWDIKQYGDPPCFTPMVVVVESTQKTLSAKEHDVHELWDGATVTFPLGARLAVHSPFRLAEPNLSGMVEFIPDDTMEEGMLEVKAYEDSTDFIFQVSCHPDFHQRFQRAVGDPHVPENVSPLVAAACFSILQKEYADEEQGSESYFNLRQLAEFLDSMNCEHWSAEGFDPLKTATAIYSYRWMPEGTTDA